MIQILIRFRRSFRADGSAVLMEFPEEEYDVIVDAVFGVGLKREVAGQHREVIERMNQKKALK